MKSTAEQIQEHLKAGGMVVVSTNWRATKFSKPAHAEFFRQGSTGSTLMREGKRWVTIATPTMILVSIKLY